MLPGFAALVMALAVPGLAGELSVCLDNQARLDETVVQVFRSELAAILEVSGRVVRFDSCGQGDVRMILRARGSAEEPAALGAARRGGGRILPEIELYVDPVARLVETRLPGVLGRALARVAMHELAHYLQQSGEHLAEGYMMERLGPAHLIAADRRLFRLAPPRPRD